jgi:hypothetical protein
MSDTLIRLLSDLPSAEPDRARSERVRSRCRAQLARQAPRTPVTRAAPPNRNRFAQLWQPLIATLGAAYLLEVIVQALAVYGLL